MIPQNLDWAFEDGRRVHTIAETGKMKRHRLADLVLPSGKISTGYPGDHFSNQPNRFQPQVPPGSYPVLINVVRNKGAAGGFAFEVPVLQTTILFHGSPLADFSPIVVMVAYSMQVLLIYCGRRKVKCPVMNGANKNSSSPRWRWQFNFG